MDPTLPLRSFSLRSRFSRRRRRWSIPVEKSARRTCTKNISPARGQIESEVVADVRLARTGESSERSRGGRMSWRKGVGGGRMPGVSYETR